MVDFIRILSGGVDKNLNVDVYIFIDDDDVNLLCNLFIKSIFDPFVLSLCFLHCLISSF